jgi:hypothetical protein
MYVFPITNIQFLTSITPIAKVYGIDGPSKLITCFWACTQGLLIKGLLLWTVFLFRSTIYRSCYHELADHYKFPLLNWSQIYYLWDFVYCQNFCYFISFLICVLSTRVMVFLQCSLVDREQMVHVVELIHLSMLSVCGEVCLYLIALYIIKFVSDFRLVKLETHASFVKRGSWYKHHCPWQSRQIIMSSDSYFVCDRKKTAIVNSDFVLQKLRNVKNYSIWKWNLHHYMIWQSGTLLLCFYHYNWFNGILKFIFPWEFQSVMLPK